MDEPYLSMVRFMPGVLEKATDTNQNMPYPEPAQVPLGE